MIKIFVNCNWKEAQQNTSRLSDWTGNALAAGRRHAYVESIHDLK